MNESEEETKPLLKSDVVVHYAEGSDEEDTSSKIASAKDHIRVDTPKLHILLHPKSFLVVFGLAVALSLLALVHAVGSGAYLQTNSMTMRVTKPKPGVDMQKRSGLNSDGLELTAMPTAAPSPVGPCDAEHPEQAPCLHDFLGICLNRVECSGRNTTDIEKLGEPRNKLHINGTETEPEMNNTAFA